MSFLAPWAAWFLAGLPVIVLLYLLKLKRRAMPVSTLMFWQRVLVESRRRALFQKLRQILSLLLHLLIFLLILGALARPVFDRTVREGSSTVLIFDTRARMQALETGGQSRLELAKKMVADFLGQASAGRQLAILRADASTSVVTPFTDDEKALRSGLESMLASDATGDIAPAVELAQQLLAARGGAKRIVVFTAPGTELNAPAGAASVQWIPVGTARDNVAITQFSTRHLLASPQTSEVLLKVANFSAQATTANVEISLDGQLLDVKPLQLAAGERKALVFPAAPNLPTIARGWLKAQLSGADALPLDNAAYAVLPPHHPRRVLLVSKGNWFLEKLLDADQSVKFELLTPESFQLSLAEQFDAVILDGILPGNFSLASTRGNILFIKETPFSSGGDPLEQPLIADTDTQHPALRLVNLQNVTVVRAAALAEPKNDGGWIFETPIRSVDHPLLITGEKRTAAGAQRLAALALDITDSDLPLRVAFPLLISNTVQWLAGGTPPGPPQLATGEAHLLAPSQTIWNQPQTLWTPEMKPLPSELVRGIFVPERNGFYLQQQPEGDSWLSVNTFSEAESDLRAATGADAGPSLTWASAVNFAGWPLWRYLALAALLLFTVEWWLFHRRRTE